MEIWKDINGFSGYQVSSCGRVWSIKRNKMLKPALKSNGYLQVCLYKDGIRNYIGVHRLVAENFIDNPDNLPQVNHIDEDKTNNHVENLEWCSPVYNNTYGTRLARCKETINKNNKLGVGVLVYDLNHNIIGEYKSLGAAARELNIPSATLRQASLRPDATTHNYIIRRI